MRSMVTSRCGGQCAQYQWASEGTRSATRFDSLIRRARMGRRRCALSPRHELRQERIVEKDRAKLWICDAIVATVLEAVVLEARAAEVLLALSGVRPDRGAVRGASWPVALPTIWRRKLLGCCVFPTARYPFSFRRTRSWFPFCCSSPPATGGSTPWPPPAVITSPPSRRIGRLSMRCNARPSMP